MKNTGRGKEEQVKLYEEYYKQVKEPVDIKELKEAFKDLENR